MSDGPHLVVAGSYGWSTRYVLAAAPGPGETLLADEVQFEHGGKGSNQAVAAARLGASVDFVTAVGHDHPGEAAIALWQGEGVRADPVRPAGLPTMTGTILVERDGENRIVVALGAMLALGATDAHLVGRLVTADSTVVVQNEAPYAFTRAVLERAAAAGARTVYNPAPVSAALDHRDPVWQAVDVLVPNQHEARSLLGDSDLAPDASAEELARELAERTGCRVVLTLGAEGAVFVAGGAVERVPAVPATAVDTTGAGDCFTAALSVALAEGAVMRDAVRFACLAASRAVQQPGVIDGLPRRAELAEEVVGHQREWITEFGRSVIPRLRR
ncbi:ribokinase [Agromyces badenianii]|uniref:Ribokinase n=1 Tax=Agromyces badenianii TaxID=2080742 RepID=A0A2S0WSJ1_9MICO|nr:ribokinase [Agromyces badenianii]AWB94299.1 ribokinase [Agromyces badenianii]